MLESNYSMAASVVVVAMPFPVDYKETGNERLFKQVTFPGEQGTYRVRVVNTGYRSFATDLIKTFDTQEAADTVDGRLYRVKSVLNQPDTGIDESYWLALKHEEYGDVQAHNQYRVRGVTSYGFKSDWVYSEAREADNRLKIFELLKDALDLSMMLYDDELQIFLESVVQDAFTSMALKEDSPLAAYLYNPTETLNHSIEEGLTAETSPLSTLNEKLLAKLQDAIEMMTHQLYQEFTEGISVITKENPDLYRVYSLMDQFAHDKNDFASLLIEYLLEDCLDHIVQSQNLEVLLDNGENKELLLEGSYDLDIKGEILRAAYNLMPTDTFVFNASSTVKLLSEPVFNENMNHSIIEQTMETLHVYTEKITELLQTYPSEEVMKYLRLITQDIFMPYLVVDQYLANVSIDLEDRSDVADYNDMIVQYNLASGDETTKFLLLKDIIEDILFGELPIDTLYQTEIKDHVLHLFTDERCMLISHDVMEVFEIFSIMGDQASADYQSLMASSKDFLPTMFDDTFDLMKQPILPNHDSLPFTSQDLVYVDSDEHMIDSEEWDLYLNDDAHMKMEPVFTYKDQFLLTLIDSAMNHNRKIPMVMFEYAKANLIDSLHVLPGVRQFLQEYFQLKSLDVVEAQDKKWSWLTRESKEIALQDEQETIYLPNPKDAYARNFIMRNQYDMQMDLQDVYEINGAEDVKYALGDFSETGWPIGKFVLGINTLKGAT